MSVTNWLYSKAANTGTWSLKADDAESWDLCLPAFEKNTTTIRFLRSWTISTDIIDLPGATAPGQVHAKPLPLVLKASIRALFGQGFKNCDSGLLRTQSLHRV